MQSLPRRLRGFTLIELLVVIAIIGLLSSIVITSLNAARMKGRDAKRLSDVKQIQLALSLYADANDGSYPLSLSTLAPTYISVLPTDPNGSSYANGGQYFYAVTYTGASPAACSSYHLGALLEDSTNSALSTDGDFSGGHACTGSPPDFYGGSSDCGSSTGTPDKCFDVTP
jgi:prepilin-type N-terminal cleavage/methylation domain-containing protein